MIIRFSSNQPRLILARESRADLARDSKFLVRLKVVEGRGVESPHPFVIVADHVDEHTKGLPE
jgi:hypothetical protein